MALYPQTVVVRRSAEPGGSVPPVLRPGELWADVTPGTPVLWMGDGEGDPRLVAAGGGTAPGTETCVVVAPLPPPSPQKGALWFNSTATVRELFVWDGGRWAQTWVTADGGGF